MVKFKERLDATFGALADTTRRAILARLARGDASVMELAAPHAMSVPAVTKHLRVLARAGLVSSEKQGRVRRCRLEAAPLRGAARWIDFYETFWTKQLTSLDRYLHTLTRENARWTSPSPQPPTPSSASRARSTRRRSSSSGPGSTRK